ncbi:MAG: PAS domain S-box protein [Gammaproteobacteria bacterium]|nr:PAS domain S-box protein [Gammaproteobacteria bacterium]
MAKSSDTAPSTSSSSIGFCDWSVSQKIALGFGGLILLMAVGMGITLLNLDNVKRTASSALEEHQPVANYFQRLSQNLNQSIALLNGYLLTGEAERKAKFKRIADDISDRLEGARQQEIFQKLGLDSTLHTSQALLRQFREYAKELFVLHDSHQNNRGLQLAGQTLNPLAIRFLGDINILLASDDADPGDPKTAQALLILQEIRYTWVRMMGALNLYITAPNQDVLINFNNFNERVSALMEKLNQLDVDIGFGEIEAMNEARTQYLKKLPAVLDIFKTDEWHADTRLIKTRVQPVTDQLQEIFEDTADALLDDAFDSSEVLTKSLNHIRLSAFIILALGLLTGILLAIIISRGIVSPIQQLMAAAGQVANGDLNAEVEVTTKNEIGQLGSSFNTMVDRLRVAAANEQKMLDELETRVQNRTRDLKQSETKIRAILDNIGEGILVLNEDGRIESMNPAAEQIFAMREKEAIGINSALFIDGHGSVDFTSFSRVDTSSNNPAKMGKDHQPEEYRGVRADGSTFPMEFVVSHMNLGENPLQVCIVRDITTRKQTEEKLSDAQSQLVDAAHKSGMAEMATGVLHNIGNILNSVNLAGEEIARITNNSKITNFIKANELLQQHSENMGEFLLNDVRGQKLPGYYLKIGQVLDDEVAAVRKEVRSLIEKTTMMKEVISTQQSYAHSGFHSETLDVEALVEDALKIQASSLHKWGVKLHKQLADTPACTGQKSKLLQVITNLIKNAQEAMRDNDHTNKPKELIIETGRLNESQAFVRVCDNGCGIIQEQLSKIFNHGFTTKEDGHGFGLHTSANAMTEMHGSLMAESDGKEKGARFTLTIPIDKAA